MTLYARNDKEPIYSTEPGRRGEIVEVREEYNRVKFRYLGCGTAHWYRRDRFARLFDPVPGTEPQPMPPRGTRKRQWRIPDGLAVARLTLAAAAEIADDEPPPLPDTDAEHY